MKFTELPDKVQDWISSDKIAYLIMGLNKQFGILGEKQEIIPALIFAVVTKEVDPRNVKSILLREFDLDVNATGEICKTLKNKILKPAEKPLRDIGIDIQLITEGRVPSEQRVVPKSPQAAPKILPTSSQAPPIDLRKMQQPPPAFKKTSDPSAPKGTGEPGTKDRPFILHRERPGVVLDKLVAQPAQNVPEAPESKTVDLSKKLNGGDKEQKKPPGRKENGPRQKSAERVVHYSGPVTPVE